MNYLAPSVFRVALSNKRILRADHDQVTFRYRHSASGEHRTSTLPIATFIQRFLAHVLPPGFVKIRYYGLFSPSRRAVLQHIRARLAWHRRCNRTPVGPAVSPTGAHNLTRCPQCGTPMQRQIMAAQTGRAPPVLTA